MGSTMAEEVCYDSPWEYTSAAAKILNGRQSESTNSIKFINPTTTKTKTPSPSTAVAPECTCDKRQPNSSISSNDSGISDALRQSPPNAPAAAPQKKSGKTTGRTARHATTSALDSPWMYRGPGTDDRPPEEYEAPWDYKRTMNKLTKQSQSAEDDSGSDYYDRVPSEVADATAAQRAHKTQSVCVVSPIGRPSSADTSSSKPPSSSRSPNHSAESAGSSRASSKNEQHSARSTSSSGTNHHHRHHRPPTHIQETTTFTSSQPSGSVSAKLKRKQLLESDAERRNRLIQHLASGDTVPSELLGSRARPRQQQQQQHLPGKPSSSGYPPQHQQRGIPPQPAIRWSKIRKSDSPNTSMDSAPSATVGADNPNVAKIAIVAPSPVTSRSASADQEQFAKLQAQNGKMIKQQSPNSARPADCMMTQSFYDQVPTSTTGDPMEYEVPWEFKSKLNLERLRKAQAARVSAPSPCTSNRSVGTNISTSSNKSRSKTPPVQSKQQFSNMSGGLVKQKSTSSIVGTSSSSSSSKRATLNRNDLSLNFGCAALNPVAEEFDVNMPLERQGWYHGNINRNDAEQRLLRAPEGSYLVRLCESNKDEYALSLKSARGFMHMKIQFNPERGWILGYFSQPFERIPPMIRYYSVNKLPIKGAEHMCLLHPLNEPLL